MPPLPLPTNRPGLATVDVDDVAAAHTLALALPHARGRYLLCERAALITEVAAMLRWGAGFGRWARGGEECH